MPTISQLVSFQRPRFPPPGWEEVVVAVSALNAADRPLFTFAPDCEPLAGYLTVQGRPGAYTLTAYLASRGRFRYCHPDCFGTEEVKVYSHEGVWDYADERYVCTDLTQVLGVARYFWEYGELHPAVSWEKV